MQIILPSGKLADVRAITGHDETALHRDLAKQDQEAIIRLVAACAKVDGKVIDESLHAMDLLALVLAIRIESYGETAHERFKCAAVPPGSVQPCGWQGDVAVNLMDVLCAGTPQGTGEPLRAPPASYPGQVEVTLPSGTIATSEPPTLRAMRSYERLRGKAAIDYDALAVSRKVRLNGELATRESLLALSVRDRQALRIELLRFGGVDRAVEIQCPECRATTTVDFQALDDFFALTAPGR
jgi:hypothetical protein